MRIEDLAQALAEYDSGYLLTNRAGRTKVITVEAVVSGNRIVAEGVGHGSTANLVENPQCTLMFPPAERHGYTLLIDGTGTVVEGTLTMEPTTAPRSAIDRLPTPTAHQHPELPRTASTTAAPSVEVRPASLGPAPPSSPAAHRRSPGADRPPAVAHVPQVAA